MKFTIEISDTEVLEYQSRIKKWSLDYEHEMVSWTTKALKDIPLNYDPSKYNQRFNPMAIATWITQNPRPILKSVPMFIPNV